MKNSICNLTINVICFYVLKESLCLIKKYIMEKFTNLADMLQNGTASNLTMGELFLLIIRGDDKEMIKEAISKYNFSEEMEMALFARQDKELIRLYLHNVYTLPAAAEEELLKLNDPELIGLYLEGVTHSPKPNFFLVRACETMLRMFIDKYEIDMIGQMVLIHRDKALFKAYLEKHELSDDILRLMINFPFTGDEYFTAYFDKHELNEQMQDALLKCEYPQRIKLYTDRHKLSAAVTKKAKRRKRKMAM